MSFVRFPDLSFYKLINDIGSELAFELRICHISEVNRLAMRGEIQVTSDALDAGGFNNELVPDSWIIVLFAFLWTKTEFDALPVQN